MVIKKDSEGIVLKQIIDSPFKTTEELKTLLEGKLSNGPINDALKNLVEKGMIFSDKKRPNQLGNRWVAAKNNPLVSIAQEVEKMEDAIMKLISSYWKMTEEGDKSNIEDRTPMDIMDAMFLLPDALRLYLEYMKIFLFRLTFILPKTIDDIALTNLLGQVLKKFIDTHMRIRKELEKYNISYESVLALAHITDFDNRIAMKQRYDQFQKFGLGDDVKPVLDIIWESGKPFHSLTEYAMDEKAGVKATGWLERDREWHKIYAKGEKRLHMDPTVQKKFNEILKRKHEEAEKELDDWKKQRQTSEGNDAGSDKQNSERKET